MGGGHFKGEEMVRLNLYQLRKKAYLLVECWTGKHATLPSTSNNEKYFLLAKNNDEIQILKFNNLN